MGPAPYLIFGDLHGRVLPAFKLAQAWSREHGVPLAGLLQVGDLGYFPDPTRSTRPPTATPPTTRWNCGVQLVAVPSEEADAVFADEPAARALWFTAGNHEDFDELEERERGPAAGRTASWPMPTASSAASATATSPLPGGLRVGALWGIDDQAPSPAAGPRRAAGSAATADGAGRHGFDVLLAHEARAMPSSPTTAARISAP